VTRLGNLPFRVWTILPLTLLFGAVIFRLTWDFPYATATGRAALSLGIAGTIVAYVFIVRFLTTPTPLKKVAPAVLRRGTIAGVSAGLAAATAYLARHAPLAIAPVSRVIVGLSLVVVASGYFFLVLLIRPGLITSLKARPLRAGVTVVISAALVTLSIHTARFLPSPEAAHPFSQIMAVLLLAALACVYPLILKYVWCVWRREDRWVD
jgi:hypothetical protein